MNEFNAQRGSSACTMVALRSAALHACWAIARKSVAQALRRTRTAALGIADKERVRPAQPVDTRCGSDGATGGTLPISPPYGSTRNCAAWGFQGRYTMCASGCALFRPHLPKPRFERLKQPQGCKPRWTTRPSDRFHRRGPAAADSRLQLYPAQVGRQYVRFVETQDSPPPIREHVARLSTSVVWPPLVYTTT